MSLPSEAPTWAPQPVDGAPCPLTGEPSRLVQKVSVKFLLGLWAYVGAGDLSRHYPRRKKLGLYESPCGLFFFDPMIPGDSAFYRTLYERQRAHERLNKDHMTRVEYLRAAAHVRPGDKVLDVGCGAAMFRDHVTHADYRGLDPYAEPDAPAYIVRESIERHARTHAGVYDVVCAFQVIEHVADPRGFVAEMAKVLKPGGTLILCGPLHPSQLTQVPNNPINGPPHHLTWWNRRAFEALCRVTGLEVAEIEALPPSPYQAAVFWWWKFLPFRTDPGEEVYYASRKHWAVELVVASWLAKAISMVRGLPKDARPVDIFLAARKP